MTKEWLREIVRTTKEKASELGVKGLRFESPQKLDKIKIKNQVFLEITLKELIAMPDKGNQEIKNAKVEVQYFGDLKNNFEPRLYQFSYVHPKKRKRKNRMRLLEITEGYGNDHSVEIMIEQLGKIGYEEEMKEYKLKTMFDKNNQDVRWALREYVDEVETKSLKAAEILIGEKMKQLDDLVLSVEKQLEDKRKQVLGAD